TLPEPTIEKAANINTPRRLAVDAQNRWWQVARDLTVLPPPDVRQATPRIQPPPSGSTHLAVHFSPDAPANTRVFAAATHQSGAPVVGVWEAAAERWVWQRPTNEFGWDELGLPHFESTAVFSPSGDRVAVVTPGP